MVVNASEEHPELLTSDPSLQTHVHFLYAKNKMIDKPAVVVYNS